MTMADVTHSVSAVLGGFLGWFMGGYDGFLQALLLFVIIDYITGTR